MARMGSEHQARLSIPISRIWIDAASEQISHNVGIASPNGIFPTDIHSTNSPRANSDLLRQITDQYRIPPRQIHKADYHVQSIAAREKSLLFRKPESQKWAAGN